MSDNLMKRRLGTTGLSVTPVCFGTSPLGSMPDLYGYPVEETQAIATLRQVLAGPVNFLDTANAYGASEERIGKALALGGGLPADFVLATKADPDPVTKEFSAERVRASVLESLERLGLDALDLLYLHDPERLTFAEGMSPGGPVEGLLDLKDRGVVAHLGIAAGSIDLLWRYVSTGIFEVVLSHNRYTLVDQSAESLFRFAAEKNVAVINAAPYGGGMLARGPQSQPIYAYRRDDASLRRKVERMQQICRDYEIPLAAAALQFSVRQLLITSTVVGASSPDHVQRTLALLDFAIPADLWEELRSV